jgi:hypothetical protein
MELVVFIWSNCTHSMNSGSSGSGSSSSSCCCCSFDMFTIYLFVRCTSYIIMS